MKLSSLNFKSTHTTICSLNFISWRSRWWTSQESFFHTRTNLKTVKLNRTERTQVWMKELHVVMKANYICCVAIVRCIRETLQVQVQVQYIPANVARRATVTISKVMATTRMISIRRSREFLGRQHDFCRWWAIPDASGFVDGLIVIEIQAHIKSLWTWSSWRLHYS